MTWPFCAQCGTILDPPVADCITCDYCGYRCKFDDINIGEVITFSALRTKPAWVGDDEEAHAPHTDPASHHVKHNESKHVLIEEPCPKCGNHELYFYTMQLRSVDEGSTVFYECPKCAHKYSQNN
jgi:DNA-directed RNA polymerase I subunit RPA12